MKKMALMDLFGCVLTLKDYAQQPFDIRIAISKELTRHTNWDAAFAKQKSFAYFFAITISYNQQGKSILSILLRNWTISCAQF